MFIGRQSELKLLQKAYQKKSGQLIVIYGRRRVGKSSLIKHSCRGKNSYYFEGIEGEKTPEQCKHFVHQLRQQMKDPLLNQVEFKNWDAIFTYLTQKIKKPSQTILILDELQWMAVYQNKLIALIKYYWDHHWKNLGVNLVLCGSIASFMVKKVLNSRALYGRVNLEILLKGLPPNEAIKMLKKRSPEEVLKYLLIFGGIPKYLEEIDAQRSFEVNLNQFCFHRNGLMVREFEKIFYGQFPEARSYLKIIHALVTGPKTLSEISKQTKIASGGGLKSFLTNLIQAEFINEEVPFGRKTNSKLKKYRIEDEYINFFFKFIEPHRSLIEKENPRSFFQRNIKPTWNSWLGLAFERFCVKHAYYLAERMDFAKDVIEAGSLFERKKPGYQIDLLYRRQDKVLVLVEIKYLQEKVSPKIIPTIEQKAKLLKIPREYTLEKALISVYGPSTALLESEYFQYCLTLEDIFSPKSS